MRKGFSFREIDFGEVFCTLLAQDSPFFKFLISDVVQESRNMHGGKMKVCR